MITGHIIRQRLNLCDSHVVADTIDYLEAKFIFRTDDWNGLDKWVHFAKDSAVYDIRLTEDCIRKENHLNLSAGMWKVYLHGNEFRDGEVIQRITTDEVVLYVIPTGTLDGEPFPTVPPSAGEQIIASAEAAEAGAKAAAVEARQAADEAAQYEPEVFWAEYGVTAFADVAAAYDAGKLCGVRYLNLRFIAARTSYATERFIEFTGTSYYRDHYMIRVTANDRWSIYEEELLTRRFDVAENIEVDPDSTEVPTVKAVYEAIQNYSDPAIVEALRKAKESGEFDGEPGENGITPHIGANGNWWVGETDTGIPARGKDGEDYILTDEDKEEIAGMIPGGGGGSSGGGVVTITDNGDGTYSSSHTVAEIDEMAKTGAVVATYLLDGVPAFDPLYVCISAEGFEVAQFVSANAIDEGYLNTHSIMIIGSEVMCMTNITPFAEMQGAADNSGGTSGLVPAPGMGNQNAVLHGDGTWREIKTGGNKIIVTVGMDESGNFTVDMPFNDVFAAFNNGIEVIYDVDGSMMPVSLCRDTLIEAQSFAMNDEESGYSLMAVRLRHQPSDGTTDQVRLSMGYTALDVLM